MLKLDSECPTGHTMENIDICARGLLKRYISLDFVNLCKIDLYKNFEGLSVKKNDSKTVVFQWFF